MAKISLYSLSKRSREARCVGVKTELVVSIGRWSSVRGLISGCMEGGSSMSVGVKVKSPRVVSR